MHHLPVPYCVVFAGYDALYHANISIAHCSYISEVHLQVQSYSVLPCSFFTSSVASNRRGFCYSFLRNTFADKGGNTPCFACCFPHRAACFLHCVSQQAPRPRSVDTTDIKHKSGKNRFSNLNPYSPSPLFRFAHLGSYHRQIYRLRNTTQKSLNDIQNELSLSSSMRPSRARSRRVHSGEWSPQSPFHS